LSYTIKKALALRDDEPENLDDLVAIAIRLDNNDRTFKENNRYNETYRPSSTRVEPATTVPYDRQKSFVPFNRVQRPKDADNQDRNGETAPKPLGLICYSCKKPGHLSRNCLTRPEDVNRRFNNMVFEELQEDEIDEFFEDDREPESGEASGNEEEP